MVSLMKLLLLPISLIFFTYSTPASALNNCNGIWTDVSCEELEKGVERFKNDSSSNVEGTSRASNDQKPESSGIDRESLLLDLRQKQREARREHEVDLPIKAAEQICRSSVNSDEACYRVIADIEDRIDKRITAARAVKAAEDANEIEKRKADNPTTVIIERRSFGRDAIRDVYRRRFSSDITGRREVTRSQSGVSIGITGKGNNITVGAGASSSTSRKTTFSRP